MMMMMLQLACAVLVPWASSAFAVPPVSPAHPISIQTTATSRALLFAASNGDDNVLEAMYNGKSKEWSLLNDFSHFLNQCAVQSLLDLMNSVHDRQTALWLQEYCQPILRASNSHSPPTTTLASTGENPNHQELTLLTHHGLGVFNTTLFPTWNAVFEQLMEQPVESFIIQSNQAYVPQYTLEINPPSICSRLLSVRNQITQEWLIDLNVVAEWGGPTLDALQANQGLQTSLTFLETFDRDNTDYVPSPMRKENFDLLLTLTTQEAVHRLLNTQSSTNVEWLEQVYIHLVEEFFVGNQKFGRAHDFLQILYQESGNNMDLLQGLLEAREQVADEWRDYLLTQVPQDHQRIQQLLWDQRMKPQSNTEESSSSNVYAPGEFE